MDDRVAEITARMAALRAALAAHEADPDDADKRRNANIAVVAVRKMAIDDLAALLAHADAQDAEVARLRARLEAVAEVRAGLVERAAKTTAMESAALAEGQHGEADIHALIAGTYEIAADLLGKALEG